jgi:hypothetical protein
MRAVRKLLQALAAIAAGAPVATGALAASISGVCPDGSIYIVQRPELIPCASSKQVEPTELPPLRGEYLPRPYGWELHQKRQDQNNPYNLVDLAPSVRRDGEDANAIAEPIREAASEIPATGVAHAQSDPVSSASLPSAALLPVPPRFATEESSDLLQIVELAQESAPAHFPAEADGVALSFARSPAFEAVLSERGASPRGPVVLFAAQAASDSGSFRGQLTFVQGHRAFYPDPSDAAQLGVVSGTLGEISPGRPLLGYVVLPPDYDPSQEMEIFWHDRQLHATLSPAS